LTSNSASAFINGFRPRAGKATTVASVIATVARNRVPLPGPGVASATVAIVRRPDSRLSKIRLKPTMAPISVKRARPNGNSSSNVASIAS
jgi:hypothetical protein